MNRHSLAKTLAAATNMSVQKAESLVSAFGEAVTAALNKKEKVIYSNFGTFYVLNYPSKTINHPKGGQKLIMLPTNVVKWMPSDTLKSYVNDGENVTKYEQYEQELGLNKSYAEDIPIQINSKNQPEAGSVNQQEDKPSPGQNDILKQAHNEDDIEKYHQHKEDAKAGAGVYEEVLSDGSHEFSTVKGSIQIPRKTVDEKTSAEITISEENKSPIELLKHKLGIGRNNNAAPLEAKEPDAPDTPVVASQPTGGIFDVNNATIPSPPAANPSAVAENKIEEIKEELKEGSSPAPGAKQPGQTTQHGPIFSGTEGSLAFDKTNTEYKDLSKIIVSKDLLAKIPENIARSFRSVIFDQQDEQFFVAMVDPEDVETREMIKRILGEKVKIFLATQEDIEAVLNQYQGLESEVSSAIATATREEETENKDLGRDKKKVEIETVSDDAPAAKIVSSLLKRAIRDKASDIHIEPTERDVEVRFRVDGILRKKVDLPKDIQAAVISRLKILSNLKIDEQRIPQDGRFNIHIDNRRVDFRVSSMPVANGEKIVMRILDKESGVLTIEQLGIRGSGLDILNNSITKSHGMVLVTGPTGSGKSTTLYAMIQKVFSEGINIITLEDPIEYQIKGINQSQVNSDIGYTFANGLRSILRQDPDIIMLGEIRDRETAEMAVHAALTGHVVLSTLHTNDAAGAAPRMIDMGVEPFLLTSSVNVVVGQRLVRMICTECKEELKLPEEEIAAINLEIDKMPEKPRNGIRQKEIKFYHGKGCKNCDNSGYKKRIGIYEVLGITPEIQQLFLKRVSSDEINKTAIAQGMVTMIQDGILKANDGIITMEEVWRATKN